MKIYDDLTPALQSVLLHFTRGYTRWISLKTKPEKLPALDEKWAEVYGTRLAAYQRQDKKQKCLPTAVAVVAPVIGEPGVVEIILMSTEFASSIGVGPFSKEKWNTKLPEFSKFVIVHEPRERGDYAWTWRIQEREMVSMEKHLTNLVKSHRDQVGSTTRSMVAFYPMFGGVRRQFRRALSSARKLWNALYVKSGGQWPGPDPEALPMMIGFRKAKENKK
jgi:hypothetical protein